MKTQEQCRELIGCAFAFLLFLFVAGCGGGDSGSGGNAPLNGATAASAAVRADAGNIVGVRVDETVTLDGSASSATSGEPLTYAWSFTHKPHASNAVLQNTTSAYPSFVADMPGTYMVQLVVTAGGVTSPRAIASVEVTTDGWYTGKRVHHKTDSFSGFSSQCAECHDGSWVNVSPVDPVLPKAGNHMATSNLCQACHTTFGFNLIRFVDHQEVFGNCGTCHNGVTAIGKSQFHVATTGECSDCHTTASFLELGPDGKFDHSDITRACSTCHNGTTAIGKHQGHLVTNTDCVSCHNTLDFKDAFVDHSAVTGPCADCHNGTDAKGQTVGHPIMTVDCGVCHGTTSFNMGGVFNHRLVDASVLPCATCHNDNNSINARGKASKLNHVSTTADCGVCHGVGGGDFALGIFDHSRPEVDLNNCASCHDGNTAPGKSLNHMPTTEDCHVCHTPGTFATGFYDHSGVVNGCNNCHNDVIVIGKPVNHIPTTPDDQDCAVCHVVKFDDFTGAVFDHTGITSGCAMCHAGGISTGKHANHMPTTRDCSDCHILKFDDFTGGSFDHLGVSNDCASCHNGVIALGKKVNHIPAQAECSQCHVNTTTNGFASSIFLSDVHSGYDNGCEGCHKTQFFPDTPTVVKAASHLPTNQDCHFCHTNVAFTPTVFTHAGIFDNCASCHDGSTDNVAAGALGKTLTHPDTTEDCGVCHGIAGGSFANAGFDHTGRVDNCAECHGDTGTATKKHAGHVPTTQDCSVCHVPGSFATAVFNHTGIVDNCASCHDGSVATATVKSVSHLSTTQDCSVCHNTTAFAGARFDHQGIVDGCATCHNGTTALGKHSNHVPTNDDCSVCHQTTGFIPGTFDHVGIVDNCQSCHDGVFAQGKKVGHVETIADCGLCHTPSGFIPATFDHSTVTASTRCDSCHGVTAKGKDAKTNPAHLATSLDCRSCHTTATFIGGTWAHDASTAGVCKTCHSTSGGATPQPSTGHFATTVECDSCHTTSGWAPASTFDHCAGQTVSITGTCSGSDYPGKHRRTLGCVQCHGNNSEVVTYPSSQYAPFCAACHASDFRAKDKHIGGKSGTVAQNKDCSGGGSGCHKVTSSEF